MPPKKALPRRDGLGDGKMARRGSGGTAATFGTVGTKMSKGTKMTGGGSVRTGQTKNRKVRAAERKRAEEKAEADEIVRAQKRAGGVSCLQKTFVDCCACGTKIVLNRRTTLVTEAAGLDSKDLRHLWYKFKEIDVDDAGTIAFEEFLEACDDSRTTFTDAVFTLIDDPYSHIEVYTPAELAARREATGKPSMRVYGHMTFDDFVQVSVCYSLYSKEDILNFAFAAFDSDQSGVIDEKEFVELCETVNGRAPTFPGNFLRAMSEFDSNDDGLIDFDEFKMLNQRYPMVLFPAFQLQDRIQKGTLGEYRWVEMNKRVAESKKIEEYKRKHNGRLPPMGCWKGCMICLGITRIRQFSGSIDQITKPKVPKKPTAIDVVAAPDIGKGKEATQITKAQVEEAKSNLDKYAPKETRAVVTKTTPVPKGARQTSTGRTLKTAKSPKKAARPPPRRVAPGF